LRFRTAGAEFRAGVYGDDAGSQEIFSVDFSGSLAGCGLGRKSVTLPNATARRATRPVRMRCAG
jgi:hypothetical protein